MVLRRPNILPSLAIAPAVALLALAGAPSSASAGGAACEKWGGTNPTQLTKKQAQKAVLCLTNRERSRAGVPRLKRSKQLERAATRHTRRMRASGCFSHQCPGEPDLTGRLKDARYLSGGLDSWHYAENIAWGDRSYATPANIVESWMDSPPHRANILNRSLRDLGVGFAKGTPTSKNANGGLYTQNFGRRSG